MARFQPLLDILQPWYKEQQKICRDLLAVNPQDPELLRCDMGLHVANQAFESLKDKTDQNEQDTIATQALQQFIKAYLDLSFINESHLVNSEFSSENASTQVKTILDGLENCFISATQLSQIINKDLNSILSPDEVSCIHWRKGALCYMLLKTAWEKIETSTLFVNNTNLLFLGVDELRKMLSVKSVQLDPPSSDKRDVAQLIKEGIFSDIHLLANIYAGELAYISWLYGKKLKTDLAPNNEFLSLRNDSIEFLEKYIRITSTILKGQGWSTTDAQSMLSQLKSE